MTKFIVKGKVKYNDVTYSSGSVVEVEDKDVKEFKKYGWEIVPDKKGNKKPEVKEDKQPEQETKEEIKDTETKEEVKDSGKNKKPEVKEVK